MSLSSGKSWKAGLFLVCIAEILQKEKFDSLQIFYIVAARRETVEAQETEDVLSGIVCTIYIMFPLDLTDAESAA